MIYKGINFDGYAYDDPFNMYLNWNLGTVFLGERFLALIEAGENDVKLNDGVQDIATYTSDANGYVIIDFTDWVRAKCNTETGEWSCDIDVYVGEDVISILHRTPQNYRPVRLYNPDKMIIPPTDYFEAGALIIPPSRYLSHNDGTPLQTEFVALAADEHQWSFRTDPSGAWEEISRDTNPISFDQFLEIKNDNDIIIRREAEMMQDCERFARLSWQSAYGVEKSHVFRLKEQKIASADDYSLDMFDNTLNATKGREETLTLYLDKLDTYDLWYYSDVLTSGKVYLAQTNYIGYSFPILAEVTTKNVTIPSGEKADGKLEFEIKIKKYDAVSL